MPGQPALFLDRDGNLIRDHHHTSRVEQIEPLPGVREALHRCMAAGYGLFILTNQSGIGRGFFTWDDYRACHHRMLELLDLPAPGFLDTMAAPERPDEPSLYRKPSPRFITESIARHGLDPARCWMVGDRRTDWMAGLAAGIRACAVRSGAPFREGDELHARENGVPIRADFPEFVRRDLGLA
ncbi:MAG: D-glycero-alpha-D-manno-heptose-1,7-bisphosphate 7-phosphatase [Opitutia bacterium]|jgi:D-glycero-D-manno-heptose 1,7-bisphosphate phosphatase